MTAPREYFNHSGALNDPDAPDPETQEECEARLLAEAWDAEPDED